MANRNLCDHNANLENGQTYWFEALLVATGAEPVRLKIEGAIDSQIYFLQTFADARAILSKAKICPTCCRLRHELHRPGGCKKVVGAKEE
jgi:NADPH-dependent 2,4-dienoyl-CoA reductase/sulfur reductase-like enzyme